MTRHHGIFWSAVLLPLGWLGCSSPSGGNVDSGAGSQSGGAAASAGAGGSQSGAAATAGSAVTGGGTGGNSGSTGLGGSASAGAGGSTSVAGVGPSGGAAGSSGMSTGGGAGLGGGGSGNEVCPGAAFDAASPPKALTLSGNLGAHDPAAYVVGKTIYLAATGIATKSSTNLTNWSSWPAGGGGKGGAWAPDISYFGGLFHLYYAVSSFGSNKSCMGQATRAALDTGTWTDKGNVLCSNMGTTKDNWNAIDPNIIVDDAGVPWMDFGSFWGGIKMVKLNIDGTRADTELHDLASGPSGGAVEGPFIFKRCGFYYLFVSFGSCCSAPYNYTIRVGRSATVLGPYLDKDGKAMMSGGGTLLVQGNSSWSAPGHNAVIVYDNRTYNVYHALAAPSGQDGPATLRIAEIAWDANGWPVSGGP
jgi:arabinan endo-1,5-alpha-L-arabinosidase